MLALNSETNNRVHRAGLKSALKLFVSSFVLLMFASCDTVPNPSPDKTGPARSPATVPSPKSDEPANEVAQPLATTDADPPKVANLETQPATADALRIQIEQWETEMFDDDVNVRRAAMDRMLPSEEDVNTLFKDPDPRLWDALTFFYEKQFYGAIGAATVEQITQARERVGEVREVRVFNIREDNRDRGYQDVFAMTAIDAPMYHSSVRRSRMTTGNGTYVHLRGRWIWFPELDSIRRLVDDLDKITEMIRKEREEGVPITPLPAKEPPTRVLKKDELFAAEHYQRYGMKALDQDWSAADHRHAGRIFAQIPTQQLPRFQHEISGDVFERLLMKRELTEIKDYQGDNAEAVGAGMEYLQANVVTFSAFAVKNQRGRIYGREIVELVGVTYHLLALTMPRIEEEAKKLDPQAFDYRVRKSGHDTVKAGATTTMSGGITMLTENDLYDIDDRLRLLELQTEFFPTITKYVDDDMHAEIIEKLRVVAANEDFADIAEPVQELIAAMETARAEPDSKDKSNNE